MPNNLVILDNTVLSNFAVVQRPDLVLNLWGEHCSTTTAVLDEYQAGIESRKFPKHIWDPLNELKLEKIEQQFSTQLSTQLGLGERTCIAIAAHRKGLFVSDDAKARQVANQYDVAVTGTLGILVLNVKRGHIELAEGNHMLQTMITNGYHSPITLLDELV